MLSSQVTVTFTSGAGSDGTAAGASTAALSRRPRVLVSCRHTSAPSLNKSSFRQCHTQCPPRLTLPSAELQHAVASVANAEHSLVSGAAGG